MKIVNQYKALEKWQYSDPVDVLEKFEKKTCLGCKNIAIAFNAAYCTAGKHYGKRCQQYSETEVKQ